MAGSHSLGSDDAASQISAIASLNEPIRRNLYAYIVDRPEPVRSDDEVRLRNCPFEAIAKEHTTLVCGMNLSMAQGLIAGLGAEGIDVRLDPMPGTCCVALAAGGRKPPSS